jgi:hypothetical protein
MVAWEVVTAREARSRLEVEAERGLTALVRREREMAAPLGLLREGQSRTRPDGVHRRRARDRQVPSG